MICGWRRATPSLEQLHQAVFHLRAMHPDVRLVVVADPALKHSLSTADQPRLDADIETGALVLAPAGTIGGFLGFLGQIAGHATDSGLRPVVVTDRAVADAALGKVRLEGGRWLFELDETTTNTRAAPPRRTQRRKRG
jgi:hypothetical protein